MSRGLPFSRPVELSATSTSDDVTIHGVETALPVLNFTPDKLIAAGRWSRRPRRGSTMIVSSCRGVFRFAATGIRHSGGSALPRTELSGDLRDAVNAVVGSPDVESAAARASGWSDEVLTSANAGFVRPPVATTVGEMRSRRFFVGPNQDGGRSLWIADNGRRATELVRGVELLSVEEIDSGLYVIRVEASTPKGPIVRERMVGNLSSSGG